MRTKLFFLALSFAVLAGCFSATKIKELPAGADTTDKRLVVAVVDFENKTGEADYDSAAQSVTGKFIDELQKTKRYRLVERNRLEAVLKELKLNMTGLVNPDTAKAVGNQLGVDALLFGNLSSIKYSENKQTIFIMYSTGKKIDVSLDARLVDIGTGELLETAQASAYVKQRNWVAFWVAKLGKSMDKKSIVQTGTELASKQLAREIASK